MKKLFTKTLISITGVIALLSTTVVSAKLNNESQNTALEAQIKQNINDMLSYTEAPVSKVEIAKKMKTKALQLQTNELVRGTDEKLPKLKFKLVIAE